MRPPAAYILPKKNIEMGFSGFHFDWQKVINRQSNHLDIHSHWPSIVQSIGLYIIVAINFTTRVTIRMAMKRAALGDI